MTILAINIITGLVVLMTGVALYGLRIMFVSFKKGYFND